MLRVAAWSLLALVTPCALGCAATSSVDPKTVQAAPPLRVFDGTDRLQIELQMKVQAFYSTDGKRASSVLGTLVHSSSTTPVRIKRIGKSSRLICQNSKMMLISPPEKVSVRSLPANHTVFLFPSCNDEGSASNVLLGPHHLHATQLASKVAWNLGFATLKSRPVLLTIRDPQTDASRGPTPAFFIEHVRNLALRQTGSLDAYFGLDDLGGYETFRDMDPAAAADTHLFHIMINNRDWQLFELAPIARKMAPLPKPVSLHNYFVLRPKSGRPIPVPFDFDQSSFVGVPKTLAKVMGDTGEELVKALATPAHQPDAPWMLRWMTLALFDFHLQHGPEAQRAISRFNEKEASILALVTSPLWPLPVQGRAVAHIKGFFEATRLPLPRVLAAGPLHIGPKGKVACTTNLSSLPVRVKAENEGWAHVEFLQKLGFADGQAHPICQDAAEVVSAWVPADRVADVGAASAPRSVQNTRATGE